ncbi:NAD(P)-dependent oxidoreductase [Pseudomonas citronellolis]|uniref:NAD(P)-dependent oxidoreductase n=1 Tax=Pseudomonas citronellolis TaxID=53408 RepID=UPI0020A10B39|nr:NAD(P)-binding domain-containing protein [Pseudomonas citronellolis]MCP1653333.1 3-hydroxyisobutyrate dehydrogenase-like beta-hydroxyacid dehydrogenase [Pseudomonas citronellolis]MCP1720347.1 3-hydroxyisobutyrate dehydrogenase-like beta-hydroxyacid dehydrogenase [Pseudomonas citronellolis]
MHSNDDRSSGFDVSILGLGAMGTIMARAFLKQGKRVAIWNRSPGKAEALVAAGAHLCESAEAALAASPVAICVLLDGAALRQTLGADGVTHALANCTIVNFTTGSEEDDLALEELITPAGGHYVKGMVVAYPRNVGHPESYCIYTGEREAFERHRELLEVLAGNALFLPWGEALAFATILHAYSFAAMVAFYEAVGASQHFGVSLPKMARLLRDSSRFFVADALEDAVRRFEEQDFAGDQARLDVHASAFAVIAESMHAGGARTPVFDAVCQVVERAQSMGYGDQDIAAATKSFAPEAADRR